MKNALLITLIIATLLIVGCSASQQPIVPTQNQPAAQDQSPPAQTPPTPTPDQTSPAAQTPTPSQAPQEFTMDVHEFAFAPNALTVKQGVPVKITITNSGAATHGFALPDFGVGQAIAPGETTTIEFTPDKTGSFRFFCNVPCGSGHRSMVGTVIVE